MPTLRTLFSIFTIIILHIWSLCWLAFLCVEFLPFYAIGGGVGHHSQPVCKYNRWRDTGAGAVFSRLNNKIKMTFEHLTRTNWKWDSDLGWEKKDDREVYLQVYVLLKRELYLYVVKIDRSLGFHFKSTQSWKCLLYNAIKQSIVHKTISIGKTIRQICQWTPSTILTSSPANEMATIIWVNARHVSRVHGEASGVADDTLTTQCFVNGIVRTWWLRANHMYDRPKVITKLCLDKRKWLNRIPLEWHTMTNVCIHLPYYELCAQAGKLRAK